MVPAQTSYVDAYLEPFAEWLTDPGISELAINPGGLVWIERAGAAHMIPAGTRKIEPANAIDIAQAIVGDAKAKVSKSRPLVSGKIDYRGRPLRVQVAIAPAVEHGASLSIRLFSTQGMPGFKAEYLFGEAVSLEAKRCVKMAEVRKLAEADLNTALQRLIELRLNILISGGTSTGKTTFARHLLGFVNREERMITIEDAFELFPPQSNAVGLLSERDKDSPRSTEVLLAASLRMRPDRIIVGELRGREAITYLEAINTGHGGSISTLHAETAKLAIDRLAIMVLQAGTPLTFAEVKDYIARSIDVIVQLGRSDGRRGVTELYFPGDEVG
ncbi:type II secretion system protein E [Parasedimentitalea maritima]|uniref:Type II secretion system protein E n=1 Tax=Parasedimentitalea maritima TaxID=2578117 RepID=A0ABY2UQJ0_9RHOB|nr:type II secretion system protein E [Zongyanglinia marina]